jgi:hypothetical protein
MLRMAITALLLTASCTNRNTHRVVVDYPEPWPIGDYRNCSLMHLRSDVFHSDLPQLDCDVEAYETPRSRVFVLDVEFLGNYRVPTATDVPWPWTCRRTEKSLVCRS